MKIYLSGPVTGTNNYHKRFKDKENTLIANGFMVINPIVENAKLATDDYETLMQNCLKLLDGCDAIYMMEHWENSLGANREYGYALGKGLAIFFSISEAVFRNVISK